MPTAHAALEAQIWPVMEGLARAAVAEICRVIDSECVEMRLEIHRGQTEIESLKGKLRDLKKALKSSNFPVVSAFQPPSLDSHYGEQERDTRAEDLCQKSVCGKEKEDSTTTSHGLTDNLQEDINQRSQNSFLSCKNEQIVFSVNKKGVEFQPSQIHSDSLTTAGEADTGGHSTTAVKVESDSHPVSIAECRFEGCQTDQKLSTNTDGQMIGGNNGHSGSEENIQPLTHYSLQSCDSEVAHCEYDVLFGHLNKQKNDKGSLFMVQCKMEPEEEPMSERPNESVSCEMDSDALPWPFFSTVNFEAQGCSSKIQEILHTPTDSQLFHLAGTSGILPSCSIKHVVESRVKQARKIHDRIQARTFKQNSWSAMLTKVKNLPKTNKHKLLSCTFCPKSFYNASDLKRHQRIHTGEKPFGCAVCGKRFALRGNLITHERAHSGSKPFTCQQCGKSFAHGSNLTAHQRVHTGEKPFCCSQCGKTFAWHFPFKRHMNLHGQHGPTT